MHSFSTGFPRIRKDMTVMERLEFAACECLNRMDERSHLARALRRPLRHPITTALNFVSSTHMQNLENKDRTRPGQGLCSADH